MSTTLNFDSSFTFRFLKPGDQHEVKTLCQECFPVRYADQWYDDIVQENKYFSLGICDIQTQQLLGLIVANLLPIQNCNHEDQRILNKSFSSTTTVCYILILGIARNYRRQGLAGHLFDRLLQKVVANPTCKAIYLHVLHSNKQAIQFYKSKSFQYRLHLPYYYLIDGRHYDACCFVRYINGGKPPLTCSDLFSNFCQYLFANKPCRLLRAVKYFLIDRIVFFQRPLSYKPISSII